MIDKMKTMLTILLIVIVVFAVGYSIVRLIISAFEKPTLITIENLDEYMLEENVVVNYSIYYYYEGCLANFIEACEKEMYNELYNIYISDYADEQSKDEIIASLKDIKAKLTPRDIDEEIKYNLEKLYSFETDYLAEVSINENTVYLVFTETSNKELNYNFALVK